MYDMDVMTSMYNARAFPVGVVVPEEFAGRIFWIHSDLPDLHPGYALLAEEHTIQLPDLNKGFRLVFDAAICAEMIGLSEHSGPAYTLNNDVIKNKMEAAMKNQIPMPLTAETVFMKATQLLGLEAPKVEPWKPREKHMPSHADVVPYIHSPYFPAAAAEWVNRPRDFDFPSRSLIKRIVHYGCDFVHTSPSRSKRQEADIWRYSFSRPETQLIHSWTEPQTFVYCILRAILKDIKAQLVPKSTRFCTYFFQTQMLWAVEERSEDFWCEDKLNESICTLLMEMTSWWKNKRCFNYFIVTNNMMDRMTDDLTSDEVLALLESWASDECRNQRLDITRKYKVYDLSKHELSIRVILPRWVCRLSMIMFQFNLYNIFNCDVIDFLSDDYSPVLKKAVTAELSNLHRGLLYHRLAASCSDQIERKAHARKAVRHFEIASSLHQSKDQVVFTTNNLLEVGKLAQFVRNSTEDVSPESESEFVTERVIFPLSRCKGEGVWNNLRLLNLHNGDCGTFRQIPFYEDFPDRFTNQSPTLIYSRCEDDESIDPALGNTWNMSNETTVTSSAIEYEMHLTIKDVLTEEIHPLFLKSVPTISPTVNMSWFLAKLYLANLWFTIEQDYVRTVQLCNEVIATSNISIANYLFSERMFPMELARFSSIFDKKIQAMLGFYSLCRHIRGRIRGPSRGPSRCQAVCPIQFAFYLLTRCSQTEKEHYHNLSLYNQHKSICFADILPGHDGLWILDKAIELSHCTRLRWVLFMGFRLTPSQF